MEEVEKDLVVNDFNIKETQLRLPARKHYWVARLIEAKSELQKLNDKEKKLQKKLAVKIKEEAPIHLTDKAISTLIDEQDEMFNIKDNKRDLTNVIEYLEKVEKIMSSMGFDIKNIIELNKLEQL
jgi:replicative superfamily II helicase